jgi:hypothetical protein
MTINEWGEKVYSTKGDGVAPAGRPVTGVPMSDPRHWSHFRKPQTDEELLELAAATFIGDETVEVARIVRERHPDLAGRIRIQGVEAYERKRQQAIAGGRSIDPPSSAVLEAIDAQAAEIRATDGTPDARQALRAITAEHRTAFRAAIAAAGLDAAAVAAWRAWLAAIAAADELLSRRAAAVRLFRPDTFHNGLERPRFLRELEAAMDGATSFGPSIGAGEAGIFASGRAPGDAVVPVSGNRE